MKPFFKQTLMRKSIYIYKQDETKLCCFRPFPSSGTRRPKKTYHREWGPWAQSCECSSWAIRTATLHSHPTISHPCLYPTSSLGLRAICFNPDLSLDISAPLLFRLSSHLFTSPSFFLLLILITSPLLLCLSWNLILLQEQKSSLTFLNGACALSHTHCYLRARSPWPPLVPPRLPPSLLLQKPLLL